MIEVALDGFLWTTTDPFLGETKCLFQFKSLQAKDGEPYLVAPCSPALSLRNSSFVGSFLSPPHDRISAKVSISDSWSLHQQENSFGEASRYH